MAQALDPNPRSADSLYKLLPSNATTLERDILTLPQFDAIFVPAAEAMPSIGYGVMPPEYLLWYVIEMGLAPLLPFFEDVTALYEIGKELMRYRGKVHAVELAASIIGYDISVWEEPLPGVHFAEFQARINSPIFTPYSLHRLRQVVNFAKPMRGRFRRVFKGLDDRQMVWDEAGWGEYWDMDSGVDLYKTDIVPMGERPLNDPFFVSLGSVHDSSVTTDGDSGADSIEDVFTFQSFDYGYITINEPAIYDVDFFDGNVPTTDDVSGALQYGDMVQRTYDTPLVETLPFAYSPDYEFMDAPRAPTIEDVELTTV